MSVKIIKSGHCPDSVTTKDGIVLKMYNAFIGEQASHKIRQAEQLKAQGLTVVIVEVHNRRLKGKIDLHGKPYGPSVFIYADLNTEELIKAWRDRVEFWKKMFIPRTKKYLKEVKARNNNGRPSLNDDPQAQNQAIKEILN